MSDFDEPVLKSNVPEGPDAVPVADHIRGLVEREPYAVLCTQGDGQPYGSVIAFAMEPSLKAAVFATAKETRKYRLLTGSDRVALVVDSRSRHPDELMTVEAITATGRASIVTDPDDPLVDLLLERHPGLRSFIRAPSTAVIRIDFVRIFHVERFQEVRQWVPPSDG